MEEKKYRVDDKLTGQLKYESDSLEDIIEQVAYWSAQDIFFALEPEEAYPEEYTIYEVMEKDDKLVNLTPKQLEKLDELIKSNLEELKDLSVENKKESTLGMISKFKEQIIDKKKETSKKNIDKER